MKPANRLNSVQEYYFSRKLREVRGLVAMVRTSSIWVLEVQTLRLRNKWWRH